MTFTEVPPTASSTLRHFGVGALMCVLGLGLLVCTVLQIFGILSMSQTGLHCWPFGTVEPTSQTVFVVSSVVCGVVLGAITAALTWSPGGRAHVPLIIVLITVNAILVLALVLTGFLQISAWLTDDLTPTPNIADSYVTGVAYVGRSLVPSITSIAILAIAWARPERKRRLLVGASVAVPLFTVALVFVSGIILESARC